MGQYFRRRYGKILGVKYSPNNVYVQSTDYDRTIMSAQANLAGLFPPTHDDEKWHTNISWQPIPGEFKFENQVVISLKNIVYNFTVHTIPWDMDYVLTTGKHCPAYEFAMQKNMKESAEVQRIYSEYADLFQSWSQSSGENVSTITDVFKLYNTLVVEKDHNKL